MAHKHPRGTLCVLRSVNGVYEALALVNQDQWREWSGAFSAWSAA